MIEIADVAVKAVPPLVGVAAGRAWPVVAQRIRTVRSRRFWRPFSAEQGVRVIAGGHGSLRPWEASGLVGVGEIEAVRELQMIWAENHFGQMELVVSDAEQAGVVNGDLIALGGPDSNWLTKRLDQTQPGNIRFGNPERHEITITDYLADRYYFPAGGGRRPVTMDVGVIKMLANPFARDRKALIMAGSYGYGTWAAPILVRNKTFLDHPVIRSGEPFECLFTVPVVAGRPEDPRICAVYPLDARPTKPDPHAVTDTAP